MVRILIADDHDRVRLMLRRALELDGHEVVEASNGTRALAMFQHHRVDIAVLDVIMPGIDGLSLCRRMRETPQLRNVGIILVSANARAEDAFVAGADAFLSKPLRLRDLCTAVRGLATAEPVAV